MLRTVLLPLNEQAELVLMLKATDILMNDFQKNKFSIQLCVEF